MPSSTTAAAAKVARPVRRALVSVFDKRGLDRVAAALTRHRIDILSTGGTAAALRRNGAAVTDVADITKWPEMMGGRVKTLHPAVHGGLLARPDHDGDLYDLRSTFCLLYTSPSPRDGLLSRMPSSA